MYHSSQQTQYQKPQTSSQGNPVCEAGFAMWKDGKFSDRIRTRQKFCCHLKSSQNADCPCHHKNFYNGKKHRGCTKPFQMIQDFLSTGAVTISKIITRSVQSVSVTIHVLKIQVKNECG